MVQFLSINFFFLDFFNFCWVFQKFPFFLCLPVYSEFPSILPCMNMHMRGQAFKMFNTPLNPKRNIVPEHFNIKNKHVN